MLSRYVFSLDIGTTSIKTSVIKSYDNHYEVISTSSKPTDANVSNLPDKRYSEQDVVKIMETLESCLSEIAQSSQVLSSVEYITICGQMHGCVLWKHDENKTASEGKHSMSNLITWQDSRCDYEFLKSLPLSTSSATPLSSGFGLATLNWLLQNEPEVIKNYDCCGTVADYIVFKLCNLKKPIMSTHNAVSWGYFDILKEKWDFETLKSVDFPIQILPDVVSPTTVVGKLKSAWHGIPVAAKVCVALGDLQCSVLSCQPGDQDAVINIGTSAQICKSCTKPEEFRQNNFDPYLPPSVITLPYFGNKFLKTSASLNGGSVFASFVRMLLIWTNKFSPETTYDGIYMEIFNDSNNQCSTLSQMMINASINGERHEPDKRGSIQNISESDLNFGLIFRQLAHGILSNLRDMFQDSDYSHIWACGGVFGKNVLFRQESHKVFPNKTISFDRNCDAVYGAAISIFQTL